MKQRPIQICRAFSRIELLVALTIVVSASVLLVPTLQFLGHDSSLRAALGLQSNPTRPKTSAYNQPYVMPALQKTSSPKQTRAESQRRNPRPYRR